MANIESKNLLVAVKAYSRGNALPLDASEIYGSLAEAQAYAKEANAYAGQTIKVLEDGEYKSYVLQPGSNGLTLKPVGAVQFDDLKDFVQVVNVLPTVGEENVIYLVPTEVKDAEGKVTDTKWAGSIWVGDAESGKYEEIFKDSTDLEQSITDAIDGLDGRFETIEKGIADNAKAIEKNAEDIGKNATAIEDINEALDTKAPIKNPTFVGTVKVKADETVADEDAEEVAVKSYVDGLIAAIHSNTPKILNSSNALPTSKYKAGNVWRVSEAGTYAGQKCEIGDVIICLNDYKAETASTDDFLVVQANIDGAVTNREDAVVDTEIAVFDGVTGKVIKSSKVTLSSLNTVITNSHTHENKAQLDTYDKTQSELLEAAATAAANDAASKITEFETTKIHPIIEDVSKKADADKVYTKDEVDGIVDGIDKEIDDIVKILPITGDENKTLNVYTKEEIDAVIGAEGSLTKNVNTKTTMGEVKTYIGNIDTDTVKEYIDAVSANVSDIVGDLPEDKTIVEFVEESISDATGDLGDKTVKAYVDDSIKTATGELEGKSVKTYVDEGLAGKADKATTLEGYGITDAYTKTETDDEISDAVDAAKTELQGKIDGKVAQGDFDTLEGKVNTLIGTETDADGNLLDANKSVRSIAAEEIAAQLVTADAKESLNTLAEIAAWIQSHPDDASAMNGAIQALQKQLQGIAAGEGTVKKYIDDAVASKDLSAYATIEYVDAQDAATLKAAKDYADAQDAITLAAAKSYTDTAIEDALTIVRF